MSGIRRIAPSLALLAALAGCVRQATYEEDLRQRDQQIAVLESRVATFEQKGPTHDQAFYDRIIAATSSSNDATRLHAEQLAADNKTYLAEQVETLTQTQTTNTATINSRVAVEERRNSTARSNLDVQLQDLQDSLAAWTTVIGDPNSQNGIYADRTRAQQEVARLNEAYELIGNIRMNLTAFSDTRLAAQRNYEAFNSDARTLFTQLGTYLSDSTKTETDKINYVGQTFVTQLGAAYTRYQTRTGARPERQE